MRHSWFRLAGEPGPGDTAVLVDGPGYNYDGLLSVEGTELIITRRDDPEETRQRVPIADVLWLLKNHGHP